MDAVIQFRNHTRANMTIIFGYVSMCISYKIADEHLRVSVSRKIEFVKFVKRLSSYAVGVTV